ncbi:neuroguidin [Trichonephila clavata]|uniref:Neuroguidin n=1 Tax=Trichonephila clavata TaxID=2740835 RepID=A0A8X6H8M5_TRICU|nr:neuroguidin [Trichonephila clavata]
MAFLTKGKKEDLRMLAWEMGLSVGEDLRILDIKHLIVNSEKYEEASIKNLFTNIIEERLEKIKNDEQAAEQERKKAEQAEEEERKKAEQAADLERRKAEMDFELQKLKLQLEAKMSGVPQIKKTVNSKENSSKPYAPKRNSYDSRFDKTNQAGPTSSFNRGDKLKTDDRSDRPSVSCYGCGKPGVTKPRCPNCKPAVNKDSATFGNISLHSCSLTPNQSAVLKLAVNGIWGTACADSGASHSIAGETLYLLLQKEGANFQKTQITMSLADGHKSEVEVYTTSVVIRLEERVIRTQLIILPYAKGNRTLLGMDFLQKAGIVLNLKHRNWFFSDSPHRTYDFVKEAIIQEVQSRPNLEENTCLLRDDEGKCLTLDQKNELGTLLKNMTDKRQAENISNEDVEETLKLLGEIPALASNVSATLQKVLEKIRSNKLPTEKGLSFLDLKNYTFLNYGMNLAYLIQEKLSGKKIENHPAIERIVESRTVLEKMKPIHEKLKFQIDNSCTASDVSNPLRYKANPDRLEAQEEEDEEEKRQDKKIESNVYVPPKISASFYEGNALEDRKKRILEKAKKKALTSSVLHELRKEYDTAPEEVKETINPYKEKLHKEVKERIRYEEEYMTRLPMSKKEKHLSQQLMTVTNFDTKFDDISALDMDAEDVTVKRRSGGRKDKYAKKHEKKKGIKRKR